MQSLVKKPRMARFCKVLVTAGMTVSLHGCAGEAVREVNKAAIAQRTSFTDGISRAIAQRGVQTPEERGVDYRIGPGDVLEVSVFEWLVRGQTHTLAVRVAQSGAITLPAIGVLDVANLPVDKVQTLVETRLKEQGILQEPIVSVVIKEYRSRRVAVVGAVREPGEYALRQNAIRLLATLSLAGGVTDKAGQIVNVIRSEERADQPKEGGDPSDEAKKRVLTLDLAEIMEQGNMELNVMLEGGEVIHVPEASRFYVVGYVQKPDGFPLTRPTTVLGGIAMAGGLKEKEASPTACVLKRRTAESEVMIPLNLVHISRGQKPNLYLMPEDVIDVRQTTLRQSYLWVYDTIRDIFNVSFGYSLNQR